MNNTGFEVTYTALQAPDAARDCAVVVSRARAAMVSSRLVRQAPAPVFFERAGEGAVFTVRSASRGTIEALPASYGSMIGHFGVFERGAVTALGSVAQHSA
ncbi:MAG: hypothetical protein IT342_22970 [Candidatus Melainabacteria bacterium]|nr:hypothetical protein [Candidatus Melainabacteria bacterium]